jgi:lipopolysaccharide export system ATP-binding protein
MASTNAFRFATIPLSETPTVDQLAMIRPLDEHAHLGGGSFARLRQRHERLDRLIEQLGLEKVRRSQGYMLSGGERRRVEIARSLVIDPKFLLLDEPFSGIDPIQVLEVQRIIFDLKRDGIGILVTDHNVRETLTVTERAYFIDNGRIFRAGSPEALARDPEVKRVYLGESFSLQI